MRTLPNDDLIKPDVFDNPGVSAFFTSNKIPLAPGDIARLMDIGTESVYFPVQRHTNTIQIIDRVPVEAEVADAVLTAQRRILIGVVVADCVPVLLHDRSRNIIGAVHAGWRGTAKQILRMTIMTMIDTFHSSPGDISVAIGPSIRGCCYEVGHEVKYGVLNASGHGDYYREDDGSCFIDLASANIRQAVSAGVPEENIWKSEECTFCNPGRFYSYRYERAPTGRQGGFIMMW